MRSIIHRGKPLNKNVFVEGYLYKGYSGAFYIIPIKEDGMCLDVDIEIIPRTLEVQTDSGEWKSINEIKII